MSQNTTAMQRGAGGETTGATDMTTQQTEALRLAEILEGGYSLAWLYERGGYEVSAELRRQHARITELESQLAQRFDAADMATAAPVLWLSPEQFANFVDADEAPFGKYVPARKTSAGKFTMPLFAARAPAPAQPVAEPAPSATAHVGDSLFESWFNEYNPALRGTKQLMRDAYAAGMDDGKVAPLPGTAYAALPEYGINTASHAHFRVLGFTADQMLAFADATHALRASHGQAPAQPDPAYSAACNLATALFKKHFAHLPDYASGQVVWGLFDSTEGVILQIDNMVTGLVQPPTTSPQADSVQEDAARLEIGKTKGGVSPRQGVTYAALPEPLEIDWPELHSQALGCGVEDRDLHNRYECAEYGWQDGVDKCAERVPEQIFDANHMFAFADATHMLRASHGQAPAGANENAELVTLIAKCRDAFPIPDHGDPIENYWSAAIEDPANVPAYLQEIAKRKQADSVQGWDAKIDAARAAQEGGQPAQAAEPVAREPLTDEQTKALMQAHRTAMLMTCKARGPECGEFAAIAQDLDWLCESFGIKGGQHGTE